MERIAQAFQNRAGRAAVIPFLTAGDPSFDLSLQLFRTALQHGADLIEIGIPYSDPLADGPVIQAAALRSLQSGFELPWVFRLTKALRQETEKGLLLFTYVNPVLQYGFAEFFQEAKNAGADGVIIPDLPYEESEHVLQLADAANIALIPLITPTSGIDRIQKICANARGFVYCVSSLGVTGERAKMSNRVEELVQLAKKFTHLPVAVGFGISSGEQANKIASYADGVIIGSAFIRRIEQAFHTDEQSAESNMIQTVAQFTDEFIQSVQ